jgi:hypothetical protein
VSLFRIIFPDPSLGFCGACITSGINLKVNWSPVFADEFLMWLWIYEKLRQLLGQHVSVELDGDEPSWFWVPAGFAHGFCVLGDQSVDVMYKVNVLYNAKGETGIAWNDPDLRIQWPLKNPILSSKDHELGSFQAYGHAPRF